MAGTPRINARLDPALARRIDAVRRRTGKSVTQIVKESLERYCDAVTDEASPYDELVELIACAEGPVDLSREYKEVLRLSLERKV